MCDDARAARLPILLPELNEKLPKKLPKHSGAKFHHSSKIRFTKIQTFTNFLVWRRSCSNLLILEADCTSMYRVTAYLGPVLQ